ncbi:MAG: sigma-70 family RNA polymerase sigma factor [Oscillospiraceae bacterium]|nr:sigma-70 family RNA polymerase sigma factor [Oscillospiraceae bacterium]
MSSLFFTPAREPTDDQDFLTRLYQDYRGLMFYTASRYTQNVQEKEEIVQTALVRMIENTGKIRRTVPPERPYLVTGIVRNTAINFVKHRQAIEKHTVHGVSGDIFLWPDLSAPLDEIVIRREALARLNAIWPRLSTEHRLLLKGKYIQGLSDQELAALVNCKPSSIRMKLTRARNSALQEMKGRELCN